MNDLQGRRKTRMCSRKFAEESLFVIIHLEGQRKSTPFREYSSGSTPAGYTSDDKDYDANCRCDEIPYQGVAENENIVHRSSPPFPGEDNEKGSLQSRSLSSEP